MFAILCFILYTCYAVGLMASQWKPSKEIKEWKLTRPCEVFQKKYDSITETITKLSSMDDLLTGKCELNIIACK